MTDRVMVYNNENPWTVDVLQAEKNSYAAIGKLTAALLGYSTFVNGLLCTPDIPPSLNVIINPGEIYSQQPIDTTPYGAGGPPYSIPADSHIIMKQGISYDDVVLPITPPVTSGYSQNYLVQVQFAETDGVPVLRPFYNAASQTVNTIRQDLVTIQTKAGIPAPTGTETTPTANAGFTGIWVVTVANGQTTITSGDIAAYSGAPFIGGDYGITLPLMLTQSVAAATYLTIANAAALYAQRPNVGSNNYVSQGSGAATGVGVGGAIVNLIYSSGQAWIAGDLITVPFNGEYQISVATTISVSTVSPDTVELYLRVNGVDVIGQTALTFVASGTLPFQLNGGALLTAGDTIELFAIESIASGATVQIGFLNITAVAN